jgi:hypothetical protein
MILYPAGGKTVKPPIYAISITNLRAHLYNRLRNLSKKSRRQSLRQTKSLNTPPAFLHQSQIRSRSLNAFGWWQFL